MTFVNLSAFYLLFSLGLVVLLYLFKGRKRDYVIPSTLLWENMITDYRTQRPQFRLHWDTLLFLQLIILIFLILAYAGPQLKLTATQDRYILIIDASASMQAVDIKPNRFGIAINKAVDFVNQTSANAEFCVIKAAANARVEIDFSKDYGHVVEVLSNLSCTDAPLDLAAALELAASMSNNSQHSRVIVFTDGTFEPDGLESDLNLAYVLVGQQGENIGITGLEIRSIAGRPGEYDVLVRVKNASDEAHNFRMTISREQRIVISDQINLDPQEEKAQIYTIESGERAVYLVTLHINDQLSLDNIAHFVVGSSEDMRVLLVGSGNYFLERALLTIPQIRLFTKPEITGSEFELYDLVVFDRVKPPSGIVMNAIFFGTMPPELDLYKTDIIREPLVTGWRKDHPLLRFVDLSELKVQDPIGLDLPSEFTAVVYSTQFPLLLTYEQPDFRWLLFPFDLYKSNLPLIVGFPVLIANTVSWLYPQLFDANYTLVKTGQVYQFPVRPLKNVIQVTKEGNFIPFYRSNSLIMIADLDQAGVYTIDYFDGSSDYFAVNLLSADETDLTTKIHPIDSITAIEQSAFRFDLWNYFIIAVVFLLVLEYYLYHQALIGRGLKRGNQ